MESSDLMQRVPKYVIVMEKIKEWIEKGEVMPGEKIHSENELAKMFDVSRHTVRQAVGELVHEGLLYREQGAGTFCSHPIKKMNQTSDPNGGGTVGHGKNIAIVTTYISDYIFPSIIRGIESYLTSKGYSLTISCTDNELDKERQCLESLLSRNIDGIIIEPTKSSSYNPNLHYFLELEKRQIPYLMINQYYYQINPPHMMVNDEKGGYLATDHLLSLGHENIVGIFKTDDLQGFHRMKGFIDAIREHHAPFEEDTIISYSTEDLNTGLKHKLQAIIENRKKLPTGIVCYNDEIALKTINFLRDHGISVPDDISIVGYDDSSLAVASEVKITSVTHPKMQLGIDAAKWMVKAIEEGTPTEQKSILYEPKLVIRNSTQTILKEGIPSV